MRGVERESNHQALTPRGPDTEGLWPHPLPRGPLPIPASLWSTLRALGWVKNPENDQKAHFSAFCCLLHWIARPPGGGIQKNIWYQCLCPNSTSSKFPSKIPKNKATLQSQCRERRTPCMRLPNCTPKREPPSVVGKKSFEAPWDFQNQSKKENHWNTLVQFYYLKANFFVLCI